ncbi:hypothetical protein [Sphaerisporangium fuscum]|uniref:hypothetical protein n=1 Tax=Sphaerisporangium fuscum TaxID=2835868 RepID=UPI001BDC2E7D|nr:hypothetical protein [Sphaerisporangium fuscum]
MTETLFGTPLKVLQASRYGKWFGLTVLGLVVCTLLSVVAGLLGSVWLTVLLGVLAYVALALALFSVRRATRSYRRKRSLRHL